MCKRGTRTKEQPGIKIGERARKMKKIGIRKKGGRNHHGRITVRHIGGGYKRMYREIEYREKGRARRNESNNRSKSEK